MQIISIQIIPNPEGGPPHVQWVHSDGVVPDIGIAACDAVRREFELLGRKMAAEKAVEKHLAAQALVDKGEIVPADDEGRPIEDEPASKPAEKEDQPDGTD